MTEFNTVKGVLDISKKLNHNEFVRAIRLMIADEYEAVQIYQQVSDAIDDKAAQSVINDIIDEERKHAGQFLRLLEKYEPIEKEHYQKGYQETDEMLSKAGKKPVGATR